jgi:glutaredoxin
MAVTIYTKRGCPYCEALRRDLVGRSVPFEEIDVYAVQGAKERLAELSGGRMIVPVLVEDDGTVRVAPGGG